MKEYEGTVLYISYDGMTDPLGQSQVIPYLKGLTLLGHKITILSCEKKEKYDNNRVSIYRLLNDSGISWKTIFYTKKPPFLSTIYDVLRLKKHAATLHHVNNYSIVHCRSYLPTLIGLYLKKKFRIPLIFDMRGFWADERIDGNLWRLSNPLYALVYKYFKRKELEFLKEADMTISLTRNGKKELLSWDRSFDQLPIRVIPCCVDIELFSQKSINQGNKEELYLKLGIPNKSFVLSYLGSIGTWYMLDEMLDFFEELLDKKPESLFLFISPRDSHNTILNALREREIPKNKVVIVEASRNEVPSYLSLSDYSIFFIKPVYSKKSSSPTKQGEIMSMGIPVICNSGVGDADTVVSDYKSGLLIEHFDREHYGQIIEALNYHTFDHDDIREGAKSYFSLESGIKEYNDVYQTLLKYDIVEK